MAITASQLPSLLERANSRWPNNRIMAGQMPEIDVLRSILENQTADIRNFGLPLEQASYITWLLNCGQEVETCATDCDFDGASSSTFNQTARIDQCIQNTVSEKYDVWYNNEFGMMDALGAGIMRTMKDHIDYIAQYSVAVINANAGVNISVGKSGWTISGNRTIIPADEAESTLIYGPLMRQAKRNHMVAPYLLSGEALAQLQYAAETNGGNADGKGDALRANQFRKYFDYVNIDEVNDPDYLFYMIDRGTYAFGSKGYWPRVSQGATRVNASNPLGAQQFTTGLLRFSMPNEWVPQVIHDIEVQDSCVSGAYQANVRITTRYKTLPAPVGCTATDTGTLVYQVEAGV